MKPLRFTTLTLFFFVIPHAVFAEGAKSSWEYKAKSITIFSDNQVSEHISSEDQHGWVLVNCANKSEGELICIYKRLKK